MNQLPVESLENVLYQCGLMYAETVNNINLNIVLPSLSNPQIQMIAALTSVGTVGKVQQGLVYATLLLENELRSTNLSVMTKPTHAGDSQSGAKGDIIVSRSDTILSSYEVKGNIVTQSTADKVLSTHGKHQYPLFILALGFHPLTLQTELNSLENTFAVHLVDFMLTKLSDICVQHDADIQSVMHMIIRTYNSRFCEEIENDDSIKIQFSESDETQPNYARNPDFPAARNDTASRRTTIEYFAGIGLVKLELEQAGWHVLFANDFDPNKFRMYRDAFEFDASNYKLADVFDLRMSDIPLAILGTCSFPCIDLSLAGKQEGLGESIQARSGVLYECSGCKDI